MVGEGCTNEEGQDGLSLCHVTSAALGPLPVSFHLINPTGSVTWQHYFNLQLSKLRYKMPKFRVNLTYLEV